MAVSYPITLPTTPGATSVRITQKSTVAVTRSPYTYAQQVQAGQGKCWQLEVQFPPKPASIMEPLLAALVSLNGMEGTFLFGDPARTTPLGTATGTPLVNGGSQTGYDLATDGWTINVTNILKAGDWVQLGSGSTTRLYKNITDVNSNGSGQATLTLWPSLRSSPADNAALTVTSTKGIWRLMTDGIDWDIDRASLYGLNISAIEAITI